MGAHPKAPSTVLNSDVSPNNLAAWIAVNQWAIGEKCVLSSRSCIVMHLVMELIYFFPHRVAAKYNKELPYLFKILSIKNALSIQVMMINQKIFC